MPNQKFSRRNFLRDSTVGVAAGSALAAAALVDPQRSSGANGGSKAGGFARLHD
jgi:hypothetical protein